MPWRWAAPALLALACIHRGAAAFEVGPQPGTPPGIIVKLRDDAVGMAAAAAGMGGLRAISASLNLYTVKITDGESPQAKVKELQQLGGVEYAVVDDWVHLAAGRELLHTVFSRPPPPLKRPPSPRLRRQPPPLLRRPPTPRPPPAKRPPPLRASPPPPPARRPTDLLYKEQWGLPRIRAPQAWGYFRSSASVQACIVDTGVKYNHPDLVASLVPMPLAWQTKNTDDNGHGTHVAGIIGAVGNNRLGVSGVAWRARILACKALDSAGWGLISTVVECIDWCRRRGARVINTSFELASDNTALRDAVGNATAAGIFFAAAAGNTEAGGNNNDLANRYPGGFAFGGNVAVANLNDQGRINYNSNYGARTVQLAAPGTDILSTWINREYAGQLYALRTGTSMAAPFVSGAAALAIAASGGVLSSVQVAQLLASTSTPLAALKGKVAAGGHINLERLVVAALQAGKAAREAKQHAPAG